MAPVKRARDDHDSSSSIAKAAGSIKRQRTSPSNTANSSSKGKAKGKGKALSRKGGSATSGNDRLPSTIDVDKFAQARSFEIQALKRAMQSSKESSTQRAFQSLPRHLRRRAASHNIRRLPTRLRKRAKAETPKDAAKPKKVTRKLLGSKKRLTGKQKIEALAKRQRGKLWLETHVWHAKRMHMTNIWGHRIAQRPTEKAFRSSYRASRSGALIHDASYLQYLEIEGRQDQLEELLITLCPFAKAGPGSKRFISGVRESTANIYHPLDLSSNVPRLVGPAHFIWDVLPLSSTSTQKTQTASTSSPTRKLLIQLHPTINKSVHQIINALLESKSSLYSTIKMRKLEQELLTFELTGKRSSDVLKSCLRLVNASEKEKKEGWKALDCPSSVPSGMIFGVRVYDPRLSFPPKLEKSNPSSAIVRPSSELASIPQFWDPQIRQSLQTPHFTKSQLDERRSSNLIPGTPLQPQALDDRIPLLLIQHSMNASSPQGLHGWTLIIPSKWGMPFWSSLTHSQIRIGGLQQSSQTSFESGSKEWPKDFPGTDAFEEYEVARESEDKGFWERRPQGKKPSWEKLGTQFPWRAEFHEILKRTSKSSLGGGKEEERRKGVWLVEECVVRELESRVRDRFEPVEQVVKGKGKGKREAKGKIVLENVKKGLANIKIDKLVDELLTEFDAHKNAESNEKKDQSKLATALVQCRVTPCRRGAPQELAVIYSLDQQRWDQLQKGLGSKVEVAELPPKGEDDWAMNEDEEAEDDEEAERQEEENEENLCEIPKKEDVVGRVTSGGFSLSRGRGHAIASVPLCAYLDMVVRDSSAPLGSRQKLVVVRNRDGEVYRPCSLSLL